MVDAQIKQQWRHSITIARVEDTGESGDPIWGEQFNAFARVEPKTKVVPTSNGIESVTYHVVLTDVSVNTGDLIWFENDDNTKREAAHLVKAVQQFDDEYGNVSHFQLIVG